MTDFDMNHSICGMPKGCSSLSFVTIPSSQQYPALGPIWILDLKIKRDLKIIILK
jgi:hypothetical protein